MEPPKYNGNMHPEEWIQQVRAFCFINSKISPENELQLCKQLIHPAISIDNILTFEDLLNALKSHDSFAIFKESCKRKVLTLKYIDGDAAAFLANFQSLCYNAEINEIKEIKDIIYKMMIPYEFFNAEFAKRSKEINSMEKSLKLFSDIIANEANFIKRGSCVTIKHAATGKYLSSLPEMVYKTGSPNQVTFAGKTFPGQNTLWIITEVSQLYKKSYTNFVFYDDKIYLTHKMTDKKLICDYDYKSPLSNYSEVSCRINQHRLPNTWKLKRYNSTDNNDTPVRSQDRIILQNNDYNDYNRILRSQELESTINNKSFQEVICHDERIDENDEWIIELVGDHSQEIETSQR